MKKTLFTILIAFSFLSTKAQLGHYILNFDSVTVIKRLKVINVLPGATTDSLVARRANGNITRLHFNQIPLTSGQITTGLGFTPYNATNPNGYTNNTGTVTSIGLISTDFSVSGSPVTTSGNITANLNTSGVTSGTYDGITVNNKGVITSAIATNTLTYGPSGAITNRIKKWEGAIAGTTASGQSIDISSAGFSTILSIQVTAKENVATVKGALVSVKSNTTSAVVVNIYSSKNTGVLIGGNIEGLEFHTVPANVTLFVSVTGY